MINIFDKGEIIKLKEKGISNREAARMTGFNRKTIGRVWNKQLEV